MDGSMKSKNFRFRIKSSDHEFDLWFLGQLLNEAIWLDHAKGFCNLIDNNPELADEYFKREEEKIGKIDLPAKFDTKEWEEKMLSEIHRRIEERREKQKD